MLYFKFDKFSCLTLCGRYSQRKGWDHTGKELKTNLLFMLDSGDCTFRCGDAVYRLTEGDALVLPRGTKYAPYTQNGCRYQYFDFDAEPVETLPESEGKGYLYCQQIPKEPCTLALSEKITTTFQVRESLSGVLSAMLDTAPESNMIMNVCFYTALILMSKQARSGCETLADKIKEYISEHFLEELSLSEVSDRFGYTKQHVARCFVARFGLTPTAFIEQLRLDRGTVLLLEGNATIEEIARLSGFRNANYFSRRFHKRFGLTPTKYRTNIRSNVV